MRSWNYTTGSLMILIVLVALEIVFFQGVWEIVLFPTVSIALLTVNLGLVFILVRPRSWEQRIIGIVLGGVLAVFVVIGCWVLANPPPPVGGLFHELASSWLSGWAASLPGPVSGLASILRLVARHALMIEIVLLDLVGIAIIWGCGSLETWCRARWARARAVQQAPP